MDKELKDLLAGWGVQTTPEQEQRLGIYVAELKAANAVMNLISPKDEEAVWTRHVADSLAAVPVLRRLLPPGALIADSGTGAGFPGFPLAAVMGDYDFELIDSLGKRCEFIRRAAASAGVSLTVTQRRVGEGPKVQRYAAVTERAMGHLENILPQCLNMVKDGGFFLAWQSAAQLAAPRPEVERVLVKARAKLLEKTAYRLPGEAADRFIVVFGRR